jgi:plastocyanin
MKKSAFFHFAMLLVAGIGLHSALFATKYTVQVANYYFSPTSLNVVVGDTIRWQWVSGNHTTTSSSIPTGAATWDELINPGNHVYEYKVTVAGTYNYVCTPHIPMGMIASFVATAPAMLNVFPPSQSVPKSSGQTNFAITSNGDWSTSSDATWCTATPSGTGNGTIVASYYTNPGVTPRTANITVSMTGVSPVIVQVIQDASTTGISENSKNTVHIYPNPAQDMVRVSLDKVVDNNARIQFIDLTGKTVMDRSLINQKESVLDVRELTRGCYFVKVLLGNETIVQQVILTE